VEAVRRAGPDDVPELERLADLARAELAVERGGRMWRLLHGRPDPLDATVAADLTEAGEGAGVVLLGTYDEVPAGYAVAHLEHLPDGSRMAVLGDVYVEPGFRDVGLGAALIEHAMEWAAENGCRGIDSLVLPGMRASKNFFARFGLTARAILVHRDLEPPDPAP